MAENGGLHLHWYARSCWILLRGSGNGQECFEVRKALQRDSQCMRSTLSLYLEE